MIPLLYVNLQSIPESSLAERDADVVSLIDEEDLTVFTFDGLKRRLGLHPETLSRILSRLEQEGIVKKEVAGYRVTPKVAKMKLNSNRSETPNVPLLQTYLPSSVQMHSLISNLKGKWFGQLRWFGLTENSQGVTMKWVTEDGGIQINAAFADSALLIEAKFLRENNLNLALHASHQLMAHISRLCSVSASAAHVGYFGGDVFLMPA